MLTRNEQKYYDSMIAKSKSILDSLNIPYNKKISWDTFNRTRVWGRCTYQRYNDSFLIEITEALIRSYIDKEVCDTIIHELLHTAPGGNSHTGMWKKYAEIVNANTDFHIKRCNSADEKGIEMPHKYKVVCDSCGCTSYYNVATKFIRNKGANYRCRCKAKSWHVYTANDKLLWKTED